jgi:hypothetical protein
MCTTKGFSAIHMCNMLALSFSKNDSDLLDYLIYTAKCERGALGAISHIHETSALV